MTTASAPTVPATTAPPSSRSAGRRYRQALWLLTVRDLRVRYSTSALGYFWSILRPAGDVGDLLVRLPQVFHRGSVGEEPYIVFLLSALLPWMWFTGRCPTRRVPSSRRASSSGRRPSPGASGWHASTRRRGSSSSSACRCSRCSRSRPGRPCTGGSSRCTPRHRPAVRAGLRPRPDRRAARRVLPRPRAGRQARAALPLLRVADHLRHARAPRPSARHRGAQPAERHLRDLPIGLLPEPAQTGSRSGCRSSSPSSCWSSGWSCFGGASTAC